MREKAVKMKSFSLEIPVLVKTIARLDVSIKNIEQIGIDIVNIAETLVSESWEGEATKSFRENVQNWKTDYDGFVNKIIAFKESLEKVILPKAEGINEKALSLTVALGGARGTAEKNIISMEQEGIEELKAKCKSLVFDAYESELEIMEKVSGLCGRLNYHFNIEESIEQNKKIIEEKQEMLEKFKAQLQDYEDSVQELEALTVQEMAKYVTLGGQPMSQDTFKELLKYEDYVNLNKILSKSIDELSDIELLVLQAAYENGDTTIIKKYIGRQLDIQHLTYKQFYKRSNKEQQELAGQILGLLNKVAPASGMEYSSREIPLGRDMSIILYNVDDIIKLVKREKEITQSNGDPTMAHKSVASAPEGAAAIMAQYGIHERLEAASIFCPVAGEAIIGIDALIYLCEGDAEGIKKDAMFFGGIVAFKAIGRFIAKPICNYIAKKVSGLKPKVYAKKLFKKLGFDKALKQDEKAVSIGEKRGADLADDVIEGGSKTGVLFSEEAEEIAFNAIKGKNNADGVALGKFGDGGPTAYTNVAESMDAQYFQLDNWDELASKYSDDEIWKINEKFLDIQTSSGREIYLSHNPYNHVGDGSFYSKEIQYLLDSGYRFIREGDVWHAVR